MKAMTAIIRKARASDLSDLTKLLGELFSIERDFAPNSRRQRRGLKLILSAPTQWRILVAELGGRVVGMCSIHQLISTAEGATSGLIEDVIVQERYRGMGIGGRLLAGAEKWALSKGMHRLQLLTERNNSNAVAFYARSGWSKTHLVCLRKTVSRHKKWSRF